MGDFSEDGDSQVSFTWTRDSSRDTIILSQPATLYTDSTTLTTGMTLYDNTGTDIGYKVGAISGDSFDLYEDFNLSIINSYQQRIVGGVSSTGLHTAEVDNNCYIAPLLATIYQYTTNDGFSSIGTKKACSSSISDLVYNGIDKIWCTGNITSSKVNALCYYDKTFTTSQEVSMDNNLYAEGLDYKDNKLIVYGTSAKGSDTMKYCYSTDEGVTWSTPVDVTLDGTNLSGANWGQVQYGCNIRVTNGTQIVMLLNRGLKEVNTVCVSTDGYTFTSVTLPDSFGSLVYYKNYFIVFAFTSITDESETTINKLIYSYSTDGITWSDTKELLLDSSVNVTKTYGFKALDKIFMFTGSASSPTVYELQ